MARFDRLLAVCRHCRPDVLLINSFLLVGGLAAVPSLCDWPVRLAVAHLVPAHVRLPTLSPTWLTLHACSSSLDQLQGWNELHVGTAMLSV